MIRATRPALLSGIHMPVIFVPRPDYPAPDPRYLRIHAACARVAHLSAAGEYILTVLRDMETTVVLAKDGSSYTMHYCAQFQLVENCTNFQNFMPHCHSIWQHPQHQPPHLSIPAGCYKMYSGGMHSSIPP